MQDTAEQFYVKIMQKCKKYFLHGALPRIIKWIYGFLKQHHLAIFDDEIHYQSTDHYGTWGNGIHKNYLPTALS